MNWFLCQVRTSGQWGETVNYVVRRSKVKVTRGRSRSHKFLLARFFKNCPRNCNQTPQAHMPIVNAHCVPNNSDAKSTVVISHTRSPKTDCWPDGGIVLDHLGSTSFSSHEMCYCSMQAFLSRLLPLREAVDNVETNVLASVYQQLKSVISQYRFATKSKYRNTFS